MSKRVLVTGAMTFEKNVLERGDRVCTRARVDVNGRAMEAASVRYVLTDRLQDGQRRLKQERSQQLDEVMRGTIEAANNDHLGSF